MPVTVLFVGAPVNEAMTWWQHTLIGAVGGLVWVILCILIVCLFKRRRTVQKASAQLGNYSAATHL